MNDVRRLVVALVVGGLTASYTGAVFQVWRDPFWTAGLGDWLDPYFINSLLEWWYYALRRLDNPASPPVFHPVEGTLGYSHGLILFVPFYLPLRLFLHPFQAYNLAILLVIVTGTLCLYAWLRRALAVSVVEALVLTAFFAASPNVLDGGVNIWTQRASVYLVPPILLIGSAAASARERRRAILAFLAGLLATLLFTQDFYSGQFTFFFAGVWILPVLLAVGFRRTRQLAASTSGRPTARATLILGGLAAVWALFVAVSGGVSMSPLGFRIRSTDPVRPALVAALSFGALLWARGGIRLRHLPRLPVWAVAAAVGGAAGAVVFLCIYLPVYLTYPGFAEDEYLRVLRERPLSSLSNPIRFIADHEGFATLRSFVLLPVALVVAWTAQRDERPLPGRAVLVWLLVMLLVFLIPFRFGEFSVWGSVFRPLPGFNAIRDPLRIIYQFELAVVLAVALAVSRLRARSVARVALTAGMTVLMVFSRQHTVFEFNRPNDQFDRWVAAPVRVDPSCQSFYMLAGPADYVARSPEPWTLYSNDAAFLALRLGIPTLHGVSAWTPSDWHVRQPHAPHFAWAVADWTSRQRLSGVCEMDLERRTIRMASPAESPAVR